jgi:hypothetical protein
MQQQLQQKPVDLTATTPLLCECGHGVFKEAMLFHKESRLMSGLPEDRIVPIQVMVCTKCETPLEEFLPAALKKSYAKLPE